MNSQVRRSGIVGFPKKEKELPKKLRQEQQEYDSLSELYGEAETEYIYESFSRGSIRRSQQEKHYEDIYQTIFPPKAPRLSLDLGFGKKSKRQGQKMLCSLRTVMGVVTKISDNNIPKSCFY